jgi:hypothetical protein
MVVRERKRGNCFQIRVDRNNKEPVVLSWLERDQFFQVSRYSSCSLVMNFIRRQWFMSVISLIPRPPCFVIFVIF